MCDPKGSAFHYIDEHYSGDAVVVPAERPSRDRSRDTSDELTEVRTVLNRARTAIKGVKYHQDRALNDSWKPQGWEPDPDAREMLRALEEVVRLLSPWQRAGSGAGGRGGRAYRDS
jgi:KaiC/GvpD/RAD55 family RecA-like ATPase